MTKEHIHTYSTYTLNDQHIDFLIQGLMTCVHEKDMS